MVDINSRLDKIGDLTEALMTVQHVREVGPVYSPDAKLWG